MSKISIINSCTNLGVNVEGSRLGAELLTKDLKLSNISNRYTINEKENINKKIVKTHSNDINDFVEQFYKLLLSVHEAHFEETMSKDEQNTYNNNMKNLVLAIKALDTKKEKRNLKEINEFNEKLYNTICKIIDNGDFPLTVGGDHIIAIGSSLASIKKHQNLGIIWFDSHADFNTYLTSVTGNLHGLPLAVITNYEKEILADFHNGPFYNPKNTVIVGGRDIDPWEWGNVIDSGITVFSTKDIQEQGVSAICKKAFEIASNNTNGVHISFDLDLIDPSVAPGVSVPAKNGINLEETMFLADEITNYSSIIKSADLVEYNPLFDKNDVTKKIAQDILKKWIEKF